MGIAQGLPNLANKNAGGPVLFEFQTYFGCGTTDAESTRRLSEIQM